MIHRLLQIFILGLAGLILAGCEGALGTKEEAGGEVAMVEDRTAETAQTRGLEEGGRFAGHALDDPASPLSKRVIYFEFDSSDIREEYREVLDAHAQYIADNPTASVTLEGHADEQGSREYNVALGEQRANAVRRLMSLLGASDHQLRTISYGEERPAALGHDESAWRLNRRVEISYRSR